MPQSSTSNQGKKGKNGSTIQPNNTVNNTHFDLHGASTTVESCACCYPTLGKYNESPTTSSKTSSVLSAARCRPILLQILSIPCFSVFLIIVSVIVTAVCILVISEVLSRSAAKELAISTTRALASSHESHVGNFLSQPLKEITRWQFQMAVGNRKMPGEENQGGTSWAWTDTYIAGCAGFMKASEFNYTFVSFGFADGSYAACRERNNTAFDAIGIHWRPSNASINATTAMSTTPPSVQGSSQPPFIPNPPNYGKISYEKYISHGDDGRELGIAYEVPTSYDPRVRPWYINAPHGQPMARRWAEVSLTVVPAVPSLGLSAPMFNNSGYQLGVMTVTYRLEMMHALLIQLPQLYESSMVLLDNNLKIVGSSLTKDSGSQSDFLIREVPITYVVSAAELKRACIKGTRTRLAADGITEVTDLLCQHTIDSFGYKPLTVIRGTSFDVRIDQWPPGLGT